MHASSTALAMSLVSVSNLDEEGTLGHPHDVLDAHDEHQAAEDHRITHSISRGPRLPLYNHRADRCHILYTYQPHYQGSKPHLWFIFVLDVLPPRWRAELGSEAGIVGISVLGSALVGLASGKEQRCMLELYHRTDRHWSHLTRGNSGHKREVMVCSVEVVHNQLGQTDTMLHLRLQPQPQQATPWSSQPVGGSFGLRLLARERDGLWPVEPQPGTAAQKAFIQGRVVRYAREEEGGRYKSYLVQLDGGVPEAAALRGESSSRRLVADTNVATVAEAEEEEEGSSWLVEVADEWENDEDGDGGSDRGGDGIGWDEEEGRLFGQEAEAAPVGSPCKRPCIIQEPVTLSQEAKMLEKAIAASREEAAIEVVTSGRESEGEWACGACTLLNAADARRCMVCDAMRGGTLPAAALLAAQPQAGGDALAQGRGHKKEKAGKNVGIASFLTRPS